MWRELTNANAQGEAAGVIRAMLSEAHFLGQVDRVAAGFGPLLTDLGSFALSNG